MAGTDAGRQRFYSGGMPSTTPLPPLQQGPQVWLGPAMAATADWMTAQRALWEARTDRLEALLATFVDKET